MTRPLDNIREFHARVREHCNAMHALVRQVAESGDSAQTRKLAASLIEFFDKEATQRFAPELADLVEALIESMAGSDATCIHDMGRRIAQAHRELDAGWRNVRPAFADVACGKALPLPGPAVQALIESHIELLEFEGGELLPMAERLLTLACAPRVRESTPPATSCHSLDQQEQTSGIPFRQRPK